MPAPELVHTALAPCSRRLPSSVLASPPLAAGPRSRLTCSRGQASVELVGLLPVVVVVLAVAYQALLAGQAIWEVRVAARAAARAHSVGDDASAAARAHLSGPLEPGLRVRAGDGGDVRVSVRIPTPLAAVRLGRVSATSRFRPQSG